MTPLALACAAMVIAVIALLAAESRGSRTGIWLAKPAASSCFVAVALLAGAMDSTFGLLMLSAGTALATEKEFLLAHLAYAAAFGTLPLALPPLIVAGAGMLIVAVVVLRWMWPGLPGSLKAPVVAYVMVIALMVTIAGGTIPVRGAPLIVAAAVFAASDIFVARERFVRSSLVNRLWGLPLYYAAQVLLAMSVGV